MTSGLQQDPAKNHIKNQTKLDPKCANFKEKYKVPNIIINEETKNIIAEDETAIKNSFSNSQYYSPELLEVNDPITLTNNNTT